MSPHVPRPGKPHGDAKEGSTEVKVKTAKAARHQVLRLRLKVIFPDNEVVMFSRQDFERVLEDERTNFGQSFMDETLQQRQGLLRQRGWRFEGEGYTGDLPSFNLREAAERTNLEWEFIVGQRAVENGDGAQPGVATTATTARHTRIASPCNAARRGLTRAPVLKRVCSRRQKVWDQEKVPGKLVFFFV